MVQAADVHDFPPKLHLLIPLDKLSCQVRGLETHTVRRDIFVWSDRVLGPKREQAKRNYSSLLPFLKIMRIVYGISVTEKKSY